MTIERQYGEIIFICDVGTGSRCDEQIETGESAFDQALLVMRRENWQSTKGSHGGAWIHHCPHCPVPR